ncbi:MAG: methylmalonyl-CoA mutase family protein [Nitrosopumilus sp.]|nr:methylmalonyl-CoA mutase family protein [Nitrosopumilus sp.]
MSRAARGSARGAARRPAAKRPTARRPAARRGAAKGAAAKPAAKKAVVHRTDSGLDVARIYHRRPGGAREDSGTYPFTRGIHPGMYRERLWTMRQYSGFGDAAQTNSRFKYMLEKGQTGLSMAFDLPTQMGHDPDSARAEGEVGKVGVSIASVEDMQAAFKGIPLARVSTSMTINSTAAMLLAYYIQVGRSQGADPSSLRGTTQNDMLKEYIARNTYIFPPAQSMRLVGDIIGYCAEHVPSWYPVSISGYHMREAGCTAVQEVAFTIANAAEYVRTCVARGLRVDDFAPRLSFFFCCTMDFFEEVAKFRAARRIYARMMRDEFGAKNPRSLQLRFHTQTSGESLAAQQPDNNIARVAIQTMAAVAGGTQSLHTNSRDEALALPTEQSAKIALRTQQIVAHESGMSRTADPLAGSHYMEDLCARIEEGAMSYLKKISKMGGSVRAIERGFFQSEIRKNAYRLKREADGGERVIVGVNRYTEEEAEPDLLRIDEGVGRRQAAAVARLRSRRDRKKCEVALSALGRAAEGDGNLVPHIVEAAGARATTGEMANALREVFGEYRPREVF